MAGAAGCFRQAGIESPQREARLLMSLASGLTTSQLILRGHMATPDDVREIFDRMVGQREARVPFQHIAGTTSFFGLDFISDARALVPRADSEAVVEAALRLLPDSPGLEIADLGTGSGCLLIALLVTRPDISGTGVEADGAAASLAAENIAQHGLEIRAKLAVQPWSEWSGWGSVDLLISNPPYIRTEVVASLDPEVRLYDPDAALDGGADGLDAYRELAGLAQARLKPGTPVVFEIGYDQQGDVRAILAAAGLTDIGSAKDLGGNDRVVWARQPIG
ncbi:MAG: peptide chain release factor N(5)-glutamine methyltransferase [Hyphomonas oceanitis]|uniref:peptide chain release factor N(5)-glutamine methyltransferase n=1 Tax=Hyphomonas oceanitis TaxID=81033 RepID=UPI003001D2F6